MKTNGEVLLQMPRVLRILRTERPWIARQLIVPANIGADVVFTENDAFNLPRGDVRARYGYNNRDGELIAWRLDGGDWKFVQGESDL